MTIQKKIPNAKGDEDFFSRKRQASSAPSHHSNCINCLRK